jgi:hypothetical protein
MSKIKQSETIFISRSEINFAPYNPRVKDPKVVESLKKNFKKVGFMGGLIWNKLSKNLVGGHKRLEALDLINNYDGTKDYEVKVESVELDDITEKEQNIYLNNKRHQGKDDFELMAVLINEIDIDNAGLDEIDIELIEAVVPNFTFGSNDEIINDINEVKKTDAEKKEHVKNVKEQMKSSISENQRASHFSVQFKTYDEKAEFLESIGINGDDVIIDYKRFLKRLNDN